MICLMVASHNTEKTAQVVSATMIEAYFRFFRYLRTSQMITSRAIKAKMKGPKIALNIKNPYTHSPLEL